MNVRADKISDAEAEIMKIVWSSNEPVTYSYIRTLLTKQSGWESPTINTLVSRLVKKGVLIQEKREVYYYSAAVSEDAYTQAKTQTFIKKVYNGNVKGLISALLSTGDMTQEDVEELRRYFKNGGSLHE